MTKSGKLRLFDANHHGTCTRTWMLLVRMTLAEQVEFYRRLANALGAQREPEADAHGSAPG